MITVWCLIFTFHSHAEHKVPEPEQMIRHSDNCGLNVLDMVYLFFSPVAPLDGALRHLVGERYGLTHEYSMAELQQVLHEQGIVCHAYQLKEMGELTHLLTDSRVAILHGSRSNHGHFYMCRLAATQDSNSRVQILDYPRQPIFLTSDTDFFNQADISPVILLCGPKEAPKEETHFGAWKALLTMNLAGKVNSSLIQPNSAFKQDEDLKEDTVEGFRYPQRLFARISDVDPAKIVAHITISEVNGNKNYKIKDVKGACSCFNGFKVMPEADTDGSRHVLVSFDRFRFDAVNGTHVATLIEAPDHKSPVILETKVFSNSAGVLGKFFVLPEIIRTAANINVPTGTEVSLYIPEEEFRGADDLVIEDENKKSVLWNAINVQPVKVAERKYQKMIINVHLKPLTLTSRTALRIKYRGSEHKIPIMQMPSLW